MAAEEAIEAIHRAVSEGDAVNVARMLDEDPRLLSSMRGVVDDTLLHTAVWNGGHVDLVRLLLERGAEINQANANEDTALYLAAEMGHEVILLTRGADPSMKGDWGETVIVLASERGHVAVVRLLLRSMGGGGLDERTKDGPTALWCTRFEGHAHVVRALLLAGADYTIADNDDRTPLQVAEGREHHECVGVIRWWEGELQRAYVLHKARTLHDVIATRQQAPAAPVPAYMSRRVQGGKRLPHVQIQEHGGSRGRGTRGAATRTAETGGEEDDEEVCAMVGFMVKDLAAELYIELLAGFHQ